MLPDGVVRIYNASKVVGLGPVFYHFIFIHKILFNNRLLGPML
jgi:hypothetical protein